MKKLQVKDGSRVSYVSLHRFKCKVTERQIFVPRELENTLHCHAQEKNLYESTTRDILLLICRLFPDDLMFLSVLHLILVSISCLRASPQTFFVP